MTDRRKFIGGTAPLAARLAAMRRLALAGYLVGLTVAPVMPHDGWREGYDALFADAAAALEGVPAPDVTVEFITHRFTPGSKDVLLGWYPGTSLEMEEAKRARKTTRFGSTKFVYPALPDGCALAAVGARCRRAGGAGMAATLAVVDDRRGCATRTAARARPLIVRCRPWPRKAMPARPGLRGATGSRRWP